MNNASQYVWILLRSIGVSFAVLLVINFTAFFMGLVFYGLNEDWAFSFQHGVFSLNGRLVGLNFFEPATLGLMALLFVASFAHEIKETLS